MTLGETLRETMAVKAAEKRKAELAARREEERRRASIRLSRSTLISRVTECLIEQITSHIEPSYKITATDQRSWVNACNLGYMSADDKDIWESFLNWLKSEDLTLKITEEHDGMGMRDWITIRVSPKPLPEFEAD